MSDRAHVRMVAFLATLEALGSLLKLWQTYIVIAAIVVIFMM